MKQTFLEFMNEMRGYDARNKQTNQIVPRYILFWSGMSVEQVGKKYNLVLRENSFY